MKNTYATEDLVGDEIVFAREELGGDEVVWAVDDHSLDDDPGLA